MKRRLITIVSALLALLFAFGMFAGCDLLVTDNKRDMEQIVAEVNISQDKASLTDAFGYLGISELNLTDEQIARIGSTDEIYKRDLVAYFLSYGYNYISYGYSYAETFETLMTALVDRKIVAQFATLYYLNAGEVVVDGDTIGSTAGYTAIENSDGYRMVTAAPITVDGFVAAQEGKTGDAAAIAAYSYFLTEQEIDYATYNVMVAINEAIDAYEETLITANSDSTETTEESRAVPTGANTLPDQYYPKTQDGDIDYAVYTGQNTPAECGKYEKVHGSTSVTRRRAYARFISSLRANYLIEDDEDISDIAALNYFATELKTQLEQLIINKFNATLSLDMADKLNEDLVRNAYDKLLAKQQVAAESGFTSTMEGISDTSFIVWSPLGETYGFVYNILLPFNASQSLELNRLQDVYGTETADYYVARNALLKGVQATDQRSSWFNGETDYSFNAAEEGVGYYSDAVSGQNKSSYLFFRDSYVTSQEGIDRYAGKYPYNGTVVEKEDGSYKLTPNKFDIETFILDMEGYIDYVVDSDGAASGKYYSGSASWTGSDSTAFYADTNTFLDSNGKIDYSSAVLYRGSVAGVSAVSRADYLVEDSVSYKALSAVNDLMFAYNTDTAGLNSYYGYAAKCDASNGYVPEFEYAAQKAIGEGAGTYYVVGTDYGWHILYVTFTYTNDGSDGTVYENGFVYADRNRNKEGTFSYAFYQAMKTDIISEYSSDKQNDILIKLDNDTTTTIYTNRYKDLASITA